MQEEATRLDRFIAWTKRICERPETPKWLPLLTVVLFLPALFAGLVMDDYLHIWRIKVEGNSLGDLMANYFIFFEPPNDMILERGILPWWMDQDTTIAFFRPVSVVTHWLDQQMWRGSVPLYHLHSLFWAALCVWGATKAYLRTLGNAWPAVLCALLFAVNDSHALAFTWLANRNAAVAFFFGILAFDSHLRWRRDGGSPLPAAILLVLSLFSAEAGTAIIAFLLSWAIFYESNLKIAVKTTFHYLFIVIAWRLLHRSLGYGADGMALYTDPMHDPLLFLVETVQRMPVMLANLFFKLSGEGVHVAGPYLLGNAEAARWIISGGILIGLLWFAWLILPTANKHKSIRFWILSTIIALIPFCTTFPQERNLMFASFGACGLIATLVQHHKGKIGGWMLVLFLPLSLPLCPMKALVLPQAGAFVEMGHESLPEDIEPQQTVIFLQGQEFSQVYTKILAEVNEKKQFQDAVILSTAMDITFVRTGERECEITVHDGWFRHGVLAFQPRKEFEVGQVYERRHLKAEILEVTEDGQPRRTRFTLDQNLNHKDFRWMVWRGEYFEEYHPPKELGTKTRFPYPFAFP